MSFFGFKSKKHGSSGSVPPATRNLHTSDGTTSSATTGGRESTQSPTQGSAANGSFSSLSARDGQPWQHVQRERADSDVQVGFLLLQSTSMKLTYHRAGPETSDQRSSPERCSVSLVTAAPELPNSAIEPVSPVWCRRQFGCLERW